MSPAEKLRALASTMRTSADFYDGLAEGLEDGVLTKEQVDELIVADRDEVRVACRTIADTPVH